MPSHFSPSHPTSLTYPEEAHALFSSDSNPILSRATSCATLQRENLTSALAREIFGLRAKTAGCIPDRDAGVRILPEIGLFAGYLIRKNYSCCPETRGLSLHSAIIVCGNCIRPTGRRDGSHFKVAVGRRCRKNNHIAGTRLIDPHPCRATTCQGNTCPDNSNRKGSEHD